MQHALADIVKELHAGPELDELLARYVMGWERALGPGNDHWWTSFSSGAPLATPIVKTGEWHASEDQAQAMQVLEACYPGISRDGAGDYTSTSFRKGVGGGWTVVLDENEMGPTQEVSAPTFPLAVARAAIAWALRREIEKDLAERRQARELADFKPIAVTGKPVSETIIEDRE